MLTSSVICDVSSFFVTRKYQRNSKNSKNQRNIKNSKNQRKKLILTDKFFITSERYDELQWNIEERCDNINIHKNQGFTLFL